MSDELDLIRSTLTDWAERQHEEMLEIFAGAIANKIPFDPINSGFTMPWSPSMRQHLMDAYASINFEVCTKDEFKTKDDGDQLDGVARNAFNMNETVTNLIKLGNLNLVLQGLMQGERVMTVYLDYKNERITLKEAQSTLARRGGIVRAEPTQREKKIVYEWWLDWQKHPEKYKGKAAFARDMIRDLDHVEDVRTITEKWCPEWEELHSAG